MTQLIVVTNDGTDMYVSERIINEDEFDGFVARTGITLSFTYSQFLNLDKDYTSEITNKLNETGRHSGYLALVA